jgi:hypothetical protein
MTSVTTPDAIALCDAALDAFTPVGAGFKVCSGSAGDSATAPMVPNSEPPASLTYLNFHNNLSQAPGNACISQGVGTADVPPFITGTGCCSRAAAWQGPGITGTPAASTANTSRATRTTPFTTASALGANDDAGLQAGVPHDLLGMTKVWGTSPLAWMHGGVHSDNVGVWRNDVAGKPFTVNYNGKSWTQECMLWVRMTGDVYNPALDPYGKVYPAPVGSYISAWRPVMDGGNCPFCDASPLEASVVTPPPPFVPDPAAQCVNPFTQTCNQFPLSAAIMQNPAGEVGTDAPDTIFTDDDWFTGGAARLAVSHFVKVDKPVHHGSADSPLPLTVLGSASNPAVPATYANTVNLEGVRNGYSDPRGRVGGCFVTRDLYGPGKFSVLLAAPPTAPASSSDAITVPGFPSIDPATGEYPSTAPTAVPGGRGYVLSMWTFSYSEAYGVPPAAGSSTEPTNAATTAYPYSATLVGEDAPKVLGAQVVTEIAAANGTAANGPVAQPSLLGMWNADSECSIHNHEIDIEIPANTDAYSGPDMMQHLGLDTANFNTWLSDTDVYGQGKPGAGGNPAFYQQVQAVAPPGQFFISVGEGETQDTFHELSFVWHVDPAEASGASTATGSYVAFYRDGVEVYRVRRFVPRRSGRVVIGLWPAWWGSNYQPLTYNQVYVKIARIEFVPQADITNAPLPSLVTSGAQTYDEVFPVPGAWDNSIACGFTTPIAQPTPCTVEGACGAPAPAPGPVPSKPGSSPHGLSGGAIAGIVVAALVLVVAIVMGSLVGTGKLKLRKP